MQTTTMKIGLNRGKRRIWIDGKRLTEAGFVGGTVYSYCVEPGNILLMLDSVVPPELPTRQRKVTGRPDGKPIIDMVGRDVNAAFGPEVTHVTVIFDKGWISIRPA